MTLTGASAAAALGLRARSSRGAGEGPAATTADGGGAGAGAAAAALHRADLMELAYGSGAEDAASDRCGAVARCGVRIFLCVLVQRAARFVFVSVCVCVRVLLCAKWCVFVCDCVPY